MTTQMMALAVQLRTLSVELEKTAKAIEQSASPDVCQQCGNDGGLDSGGVTPWGTPIMIPCPSCSGSCGRSC